MKTPKLDDAGRTPHRPSDLEPDISDDEIRAYAATLSNSPGHDGMMRELCAQALRDEPVGLLRIMRHAARVRIAEDIRARGARTSTPDVRAPRERTAQLPPAAIATLAPVGLATIPMPIPAAAVPTTPMRPLPLMAAVILDGPVSVPHTWGAQLVPVPGEPGSYYERDPCRCARCAKIQIPDPYTLKGP